MARTPAGTKAILTKLAELGGGQFRPEDDIVQEGHQLVLPEGMSMKRAVEFLSQRIMQDEEPTRYQRRYRFRPWDGAVCAVRALKRVFGMVGMGSSVGFWGEDIPPALIEIPVGSDGEVESVPWGAEFTLAHLPQTTISFGSYEDDEYGKLFEVNVIAPRKYRAQVEGMFVVIGDELETNSIYRGKAFDGQDMPEFLDLSGVKASQVIYAEETRVQLEANIWAVLRHREALAKAGISRKRSALLFGPYGTGKTLGGFLTAQVAVENGWTFLYARPGKDDVHKVLQMARLYQPACVFFEDLDTVADPEQGGHEQASRLLDAFDGITAKGTELMVVLTTNHPERIHKGMLRPGRLDAVIEIGYLDQAGITALIQQALPEEVLDEHIDWGSVAVAAEGFLPAYVKEAADRAFRYVLSRTGDADNIRLTTEDLVHAAEGLRPQLDLMEGAKEPERTSELTDAMERTVERTVLGIFNEESFAQFLSQEARDRVAKDR